MNSWLLITISQKVVFEHLRNLDQLSQINTLSIEQFVDIGLLATNGFGEPSDRPSLTRQLFMDHVAYVNVFHYELHNMRFSNSAQR